MADDRLEQAIGLVQLGKIEEARRLLELILKEDRHNIPVWHWYAQTWSKAADKIRVWEFCLRYNPENQLAQEALRNLKFVQSKETNPETNIPVRVVKPKTAAARWGTWLMIGLLTAAAVFAWLAVKQATPKDPQQYRHTQPIEYYLYAPENYSPDHEWPLFIGIHGSGGTGLDCWNLWQPYAEKEGFILLCPSIADAGGGWYQDVGEIVVWDVIGEAKKQYKVGQKMFIAGFSAGAQFVQGFAFNYPQYVSGVSVLSAGNYYRVSLSAKSIPFLVVIGERDQASSVAQSAQFYQSLTQNGFDVQYQVLPGVGHAVTKEGVNLTIDLYRKTAGK